MSNLKSGDTVRINATIEVQYLVEYQPEAYPGATDAHGVADIEKSLMDGEGDYLITVLTMEGAESIEIGDVEGATL